MTPPLARAPSSTRSRRAASRVAGDARTAGSSTRRQAAAMRGRQSAQLFRMTLETISDDTGGFLVSGADAIDVGVGACSTTTTAAICSRMSPPTRSATGGSGARGAAAAPPNYVARTRRGYLAADASKRARPQRSRRLGDTGSARDRRVGGPRHLDAAHPATGIPVRVAASYVDLPPAGSLAVVEPVWTWRSSRQRADGAACRVRLDRRRLRRERPAGGVSPFAGQHFALDVAPAEYDELKDAGVPFEAYVPLEAGATTRSDCCALDPGHAPLGGAVRPIEIPDVAGKKSSR